MGLKSTLISNLFTASLFAPYMGLKRIPNFITQNPKKFAPYMGLKSSYFSAFSRRDLFAPYMGLKRS